MKGKFPRIFTTYTIDPEDHDPPVYISKNRKNAISFCDGTWVIQKSKHVFQDCWKFAYSEDDKQCPSDTGSSWKYKNKTEGNAATWPSAGTGLTVTCAPVDCEWGEWFPSEPWEAIQ